MSTFILRDDEIDAVPFPKDQSVNHMFPPKMVRSSSSNMPFGHLRPLGGQRKSDGKIKEVDGIGIDRHRFLKYAVIKVLFRSIQKTS